MDEGAVREREEWLMKVFLLECSSCGTKMMVEPLETQQYRMKTCENAACGRTFSFSNGELTPLEFNDGELADLVLAARAVVVAAKPLFSKCCPICACEGDDHMGSCPLADLERKLAAFRSIG